MPSVPAIYTSGSDTKNWFRSYYRPETDDWTFPEVVWFILNSFSAISLPDTAGTAAGYLISLLGSPGALGCSNYVDSAGYIFEIIAPAGHPSYLDDMFLSHDLEWTETNYIDVGNNFFTDNGAGGGGPIDYDGNKYCWGNRRPSGTTLVRMYQSTDEGLTWAELDTANRPTIAAGYSAIHATFIEAEGKVYFAIAHTGGPLNVLIKAFNLITGLWEADITTYAVGGGATFIRKPNVQVASTGEIFLSYEKNNGFTYVVIYSGGSWGAEIDFQTTKAFGASNRGHICVLDDDDVLHIMYHNINGGSFFTYYKTVTKTGTLGTEVDLNTVYGFTATWQVYCVSGVCYENEPWWIFANLPSHLGFQSEVYLPGVPSVSNALREYQPSPRASFFGTYPCITLGVNPCVCEPTPPAATRYALIV
jgi:hypothetical protein